MGKERLHRDSKFRAKRAIAEMAEQEAHVRGQAKDLEDKLFLRFPEEIWNAHEPQRRAPLQHVFTNKVTQKQNVEIAKAKEKQVLRLAREVWNSYDPQRGEPLHQLSANKLTKKNDADVAKPKSHKLKLRLHQRTSMSSSYRKPMRCRSGLWRFHPGGPKHARSGKDMNSIHLEEPCLQPTCANCALWHPGLIQEPTPPDTPIPSRETSSETESPMIQSPCPANESSMVAHAKRCHNPFKTATDHEEMSERSPSPFQLPPPLVDPLITRLKLETGDSQHKDFETAKNIERYSSESTLVGDKAYMSATSSSGDSCKKELESLRNILKDGVKRTCEDVEGGVRKRRFRHRVRLVFGSEEGRGLLKKELERTKVR